MEVLWKCSGLELFGVDGEETELFLLEEIVGAAQWYPSKVNIWEQLQDLKK